MAQKSFQFADGNMTVIDGNGWVETHSADYRARVITPGASKYEIVIFPINYDPEQPESFKAYFLKSYADASLSIDGASASFSTSDEFVALFNAAAGTNIGYNTQYPQHIISDLISPDTSIATQLVTAEKAGYLTILAPSTNTGWVHVGDEDVDWTDGYLEAGDKVFMELDDLSKIYVYANTAGDDVSIIGAFKW